jgi:hypothetical protein
VQPNYVTPSGLTQLQAKVAELQTLLGELNALGGPTSSAKPIFSAT